MKFFAFAALSLLCLSSCASAQSGRIDLPSFRHLESKAVEAVDFSFGRMMLRPASWLIDEDEPEGRDLKRLLRSIKSVRIRSYEFQDDDAYDKSDIDAVRRQLSKSGWSRVLQIRDRKSDDDVDMYVAMDGERTLGFALVASEPREFTIIHVVGDIDPSDFHALRNHFKSERGDVVAQGR